MHDMKATPSIPAQSDRTLTDAQRVLTHWSSSSMLLAREMVGTGFSQLGVAQKFWWMGAAVIWPRPADQGRPQDAMGETLHAVRTGCDATLRGMRRLNDQMLTCGFDYAEAIVKGVSTTMVAPVQTSKRPVQAASEARVRETV